MAAPAAAPDAAPANSCCEEISKKYAKLLESRQALREAVKLYKKDNNILRAKNEEFKKDCDEVRRRAELEKEARVKENCFRQELEKELNDLKAELSSNQQNSVSKCSSEDVKLLEARILEAEAEKNMLKELLEKEKQRCDSEKNKAQVEKEKAVISKSSSEDVKLLEARILEAEAEKTKLRELLEKEKRRSELERKKAKVEKEKAAEANKLLAMEKSKAEADRRLVETERKNFEVCRHALERLKSEAKDFREKLIVEKSKADEAVERLKSEVKELRDKLIVEKSKADDAIKKVALERQRTQKEKICADSERKKAQEQLRLLDLERKKAVDEKLKLDCLSRQLEEEKQKTEELKKKIEETIPSQHDQAHIQFLSEQLKLEKKHAKSAKREARVEKLKRRFSCQQVNFAKEEFLQLSNRLNIVAGSLTCGCEGKEGMTKIGKSSELLGFKSKNEVPHIKKCDFLSKSCLGPVKSCNAASNYSGSGKELPGAHLSGGSCTRPISGNSSKYKTSFHQTACEGGMTRQIENDGVVPENIDICMDIEGRVPNCRKKRRINETLDSIAWLFPGDKQLLSKLDEKLSVLRDTFSNKDGHVTAGTSCSCEIFGGSETGRVVLTEETDDLCKRNNKHARCSQEHTQQRIDWGRSSQSDNEQQTRIHECEVIGEPCSSPDPTACQTQTQDDANGQMVELDSERGLLTEKIDDSYKRNYKHVEGSEERRQQKLDCGHLSRSDNQQQACIHDSKGNRRSCSIAETTACQIRMQEDTSVQMEESHDAVSREQAALICFENLNGEDYLKLLDLDNDDDERRYRAAMEAPLSPTLPEICVPRSKSGKDESPYLVARLPRSEFLADEAVSSCALDLIGLQIESNREKYTVYNKEILSCNNRNFIHASEEPKSTDISTSHSDISQNFVMHAIEQSSYLIDSRCVDVDQMHDAVTQLPISTIRKSEHQFRECDAHEKTPSNCLETVEQMPSTIKTSECPARCSGAIDKNPNYYVIFSNTKEESISRIIHARNALACQSFVDEADSVVAEMLHFLNLKPNLLPEEKVSVFFSLLMHSISGTSTLNYGSVRSGDILRMSDYVAEKTSRVIAIGKTCWSSQKFCWLDILLNLIEDFLIGRKVVMYDETQSESSYPYVSSYIFGCLKEGDALILYKDASDDQLVTASAILACICASSNHIAFLLEASYKILRRYSSDTSVVVLHALAYAAGDQFFNLNNYRFVLAAIKSVVSLHEKGNRSQSSAYLNLHSSSDARFYPCEHCPFDINATSEDKCIAMLLDVLQDFSSGLRSMSSADTVPTPIVSVGEGTVRKYESDGLKIDCGSSCSMLRYGEVTDQHGCIPERSLCHYTDIVSLVELVGHNASWEWAYSNIIPRLLAMLESCASEELSAALFVLIGQLARSEVDAGGYQQSGIVELQSRLSIFLEAFIAGKGIFPTQVAAVGALVNLLPLSFGEIVDGHVDHSVSSYQSSHVKLIKRWFLQLNEELQSLASSLLRSTDVHKF